MNLGDKVVCSSVVAYNKAKGVSTPYSKNVTPFKGIVVGTADACIGEHNVQPKPAFKCYRVAVSLTKTVKVQMSDVQPIAQTVAQATPANTQRVQLTALEYEKLAQEGIESFASNPFTLWDVTEHLKSRFPNFELNHSVLKPFEESVAMGMVYQGKMTFDQHPNYPAREFRAI